MDGETGMTRAALEALMGRMLDAETRTSPLRPAIEREVRRGIGDSLPVAG